MGRLLEVPTFEESWEEFKRLLPVNYIMEDGTVLNKEVDSAFRALLMQRKKELEFICKQLLGGRQ